MGWQSPYDSVVHTENMTYVSTVTCYESWQVFCVFPFWNVLLWPGNTCFCRQTVDILTSHSARDRSWFYLKQVKTLDALHVQPELQDTRSHSVDLSTKWRPKLMLESARWFAFLTWTPGTYGTCPQTLLLLSRYWTDSLPWMWTYRYEMCGWNCVDTGTSGI